MADPGGGGPAGSAGSSGAGSSGAGNDDSSEGMGEGQDNTGIADAAGYGSGSTSGRTHCFGRSCVSRDSNSRASLVSLLLLAILVLQSPKFFSVLFRCQAKFFS